MNIRPSLRHRILWALGVIALASFVWLTMLVVRPVPIWRGQSVHHWVSRAHTDDEEAHWAILELDSQALPALRRAATAQDTVWARFKARHWSRLPRFLQARLARPIEAHRLRRAAAAGFRLLGPRASEDAPLLARMLRDEEPDVRRAAAWALGGTRTRDAAVITALVTNLTASLTNSSSPDVRMGLACADSLGRLRVVSSEVVQALLMGLRLGDEDTSSQAAISLGKLRPPDSNVICALALQLRGGQTRATRLADAIGAYGPAASNAVPMLLERLRAFDWEAWKRKPSRDQGMDLATARSIVKALGEIGRTAKEATPDLEQLPPVNPWLNALASEALWKITGETNVALPRLLALGPIAFDALGAMGSNAAPALPLLRLHAATNERIHLQLTVAVAAWRIAPESEPLPLAQLTNALAATTNTYPGRWTPAQVDGLRYRATDLLGWLGPAAREAVPALEKSRRQPNSMLRELAEEALEKIEPRD